MQPKKAVKIDSAVVFAGFRYRDSRPQIVIFAVAVRNNDVQPIDRSTLKDRDQDLFLAVTFCGSLRRRKLVQKIRRRGHKSKARQPNACRLQEKSSVHTTPFIKAISFQYLRRIAAENGQIFSSICSVAYITLN